MNKQQVKIYERESDFEHDHRAMQRGGYNLISISSNVKLGIDKTVGLINRVAGWFAELKTGALSTLTTDGANRKCRIIVVYERPRL